MSRSHTPVPYSGSGQSQRLAGHGQHQHGAHGNAQHGFDFATASANGGDPNAGNANFKNGHSHMNTNNNSMHMNTNNKNQMNRNNVGAVAVAGVEPEIYIPATTEEDLFQRWQKMTRTISDYHRLEQIGEGTYGQVYRARCLDTNQIVALKKIRVHHGGYWGMPPTVIREIKILKRLQHPRLVRMIEVVSSKGVEHLDEDDERTVGKGNHSSSKHSHSKKSSSSKNSNNGADSSRTGSLKNNDKTGKQILIKKSGSKEVVDAREGYKGNLFLVLEYVSHDLTGLMDVAYKFTEVQVKSIFKQLLEALAYMHEQKYVHRDIKSSNILIDSHFRVKLADFGLARCIEPPILDSLDDRGSTQELTNKVITLWYRPPEVLLGSTRYGTPVDVWSAGCILAELLLGKPLFTGKTEMDQLKLVFDLLGTPTEDSWEGFMDLKLMRTGEVTIEKQKKPKLRTKYAGGTKITGKAMNLIEKLLELDPKKRLTAERALQSMYFRSEPQAPENPEEMGTIQLGEGMGHFHEFQTKKKRREAKIVANKAQEEAKARGMNDRDAEVEYDLVYRNEMKKLAKEPQHAAMAQTSISSKSNAKDNNSTSIGGGSGGKGKEDGSKDDRKQRRDRDRDRDRDDNRRDKPERKRPRDEPSRGGQQYREARDSRRSSKESDGKDRRQKDRSRDHSQVEGKEGLNLSKSKDRDRDRDEESKRRRREEDAQRVDPDEPMVLRDGDTDGIKIDGQHDKRTGKEDHYLEKPKKEAEFDILSASGDNNRDKINEKPQDQEKNKRELDQGRNLNVASSDSQRLVEEKHSEKKRDRHHHHHHRDDRRDGGGDHRDNSRRHRDRDRDRGDRREDRHKKDKDRRSSRDGSTRGDRSRSDRGDRGDREAGRQYERDHNRDNRSRRDGGGDMQGDYGDGPPPPRQDRGPRGPPRRDTRGGVGLPPSREGEDWGGPARENFGTQPHRGAGGRPPPQRDDWATGGSRGDAIGGPTPRGQGRGDNWGPGQPSDRREDRHKGPPANDRRGGDRGRGPPTDDRRGGARDRGSPLNPLHDRRGGDRDRGPPTDRRSDRDRGPPHPDRRGDRDKRGDRGRR